MEMKSFNEQIIEEFRANEGRVAMFADYPMVILHTIGAKSGSTHLVPLVLTINNENEMLIWIYETIDSESLVSINRKY